MRKNLAAIFVLAFLAGCSGARKTGGGSGKKDQNGTAGGKSPAFALPGVPMKSGLGAAAEESVPKTADASDGETYPEEPGSGETKPEEAKPAAEPEEAKPAETKPAETAAAPNGDLEYHLAAAARYSARKKYRSAAAEYGAASKFLPAGDARSVRLLERQGAMMLRAGDEPKAREHFLAAIDRARELNTSGKDLSASHLGLGYCQEKAGKIADAISSYEKARAHAGSKKVKDKITKTINDLKARPDKSGKAKKRAAVSASRGKK